MLKEILEQGRRTIDGRWRGCCPPPRSDQTPFIRQCGTACLLEASGCGRFCAWKRLKWLRAARRSGRTGCRAWRCCTPTRSFMTICRRSITTTCAVGARRATKFSEKRLPFLPETPCRRGRTSCGPAEVPAQERVAIIAEIAHGKGTIDGMIGGQVKDLEAEHSRPDAKTLEYIHRSKTGALLTASVVTGGMYGGADVLRCWTCATLVSISAWRFRSWTMFSMLLRLPSSSARPPAKTQPEKATYPSLFGISEYWRRADSLSLFRLQCARFICATRADAQGPGPLSGATQKLAESGSMGRSERGFIPLASAC